MKVSTDKKQIEELLTRGVGEVIVRDDLEKKLLSGKQLRIKFGIDPTGSQLHIGHAVPLRKLRQFQQMGHQVILLIGDFTAKIGDPTGRNETRPTLSDEQIKENMRTYVEQAGRILDIASVEVRYNSEWFENKPASFMMQLTSLITVARILERDDFKKRLAEDSDIQMQEILYPLLQGYDSVALKADVEIGGTDQKFNLLMGRKLQKKYGEFEQDIITIPLLEGTDGEKKMSKSYDNYIALDDTPENIYGKTMSIPDTLMRKYFELATDVPTDTILEYRRRMEEDENPKNIKMILAYELTKLYHGEEGAKRGQDRFTKVSQQKSIPDDMPVIDIAEPSINILDLLVKCGLAKSKTEARTLVGEGAVTVEQEIIRDIAQEITIGVGVTIQKGKRHFTRVMPRSF